MMITTNIGLLAVAAFQGAPQKTVRSGEVSSPRRIIL